VVNAYIFGYDLQGNRKNAVPLNYKITSKITPAGFTGEDERSHGTFYPPCCFTLSITLGGKDKRYIPVSHAELY
jgi:hypothetical protein